MAAFRRLLSAFRVAVLTLGLATAAQAASPFNVAVNIPARLGNVVAATTGVTTFRIDDLSPTVTVVSGQGYRPPSNQGDARARVTISCSTDADCAKAVTVTIAPLGLAIGRAQALSNFKADMLTGHIVAGSSTAGPGTPLTFTLQALGNNGSAQFYLGMDFPIAGDDSGQPNGTTYSSFAITAAVGADSTQFASLVQGYVNKPLGLSSTGALNFGALIKPDVSGTARVDPTTGAEQLTNLSALPNSVASRVLFNATGEASKQISISVPPSFTLTRNGGGTITASLLSSAASAASLNSSGVYAFGVGGSINLSGATLTGAYTGTFTVSIAYN